MNVLKRCVFGIGLLSLALVSVQCKSDKKMDATVSDQKAAVTMEKSSYGTTAKGEKIDS